MGIPAELRSFMGGRREIKISLGLKDRDAAKAVIPDHTKAALKLIEQARLAFAASNTPAPKPPASKSKDQLQRERMQDEHVEQEAAMMSAELLALDDDIEMLGSIMDALAKGAVPTGSPSGIARAGKLLVLHERVSRCYRSLLTCNYLYLHIKDPGDAKTGAGVAGSASDTARMIRSRSH